MFLINFNQWKCACVGINNLVILLRARYKCNYVDIVSYCNNVIGRKGTNEPNFSRVLNVCHTRDFVIVSKVAGTPYRCVPSHKKALSLTHKSSRMYRRRRGNILLNGACLFVSDPPIFFVYHCWYTFILSVLMTDKQVYFTKLLAVSLARVWPTWQWWWLWNKRLESQTSWNKE